MPVWGDYHTHLFLEYCIPFLMTEGNLGVFPDRQLEVNIISRSTDLRRMHSNRNYRRFSDSVKMTETEADHIIDHTAPHRSMTQCYSYALHKCADPEMVVTMFPTPDCILSRNAFARIRQTIETGYRAVMVCGLRLEFERTRPLLDDIITAGPQSITERELVTMALRQLHLIALRCDARSDEFWISCPSHVYWIAPDRSWLLAHCLNLHPIAVRGVPRMIDIESTIDGNYLFDVGIKPEECHVLQSSDELTCLELSPALKRIKSRIGSLRGRHISRYLAVSTNRLHRSFFPRAVLFRGGEEPVIPPAVESQIKDLIAVVKQGPRPLHRLQGLVFSRIRSNPRMRRLARLLLRAGRWLSGAVENQSAEGGALH